MQPCKSPFYLSVTKQSPGPGQTDEVCRTPNFIESSPGIYQLISDLDFSTTIWPGLASGRVSSYLNDRIYLIRSPDGNKQPEIVVAFDLATGQMQGNSFVVNAGPNFEGSYFKLAFTAFSIDSDNTYICCPHLTITRRPTCSPAP
jgi:hypothetical protein